MRNNSINKNKIKLCNTTLKSNNLNKISINSVNKIFNSNPNSKENLAKLVNANANSVRSSSVSEGYISVSLVRRKNRKAPSKCWKPSERKDRNLRSIWNCFRKKRNQRINDFS